MKIDVDALKVHEGDKLKLDARDTEVAALYDSKDGYRDALDHHARQLEKRHEKLFAAGRNAVLVILQGMDSAGKDGVIKHVLSGFNPQGCRVASFKQPTPTELRHDFLWRCQAELPEHGSMAIYNRSYYEAVLVERVHPHLLEGEGIEPPKHLDRFFDDRFRAIRHFERHLDESGTTVVKIFLHISKAEQKRRLLARLDDPDKNWKASMADVEERGYWKDYQRAYEEMLAATSVKAAPWFVVPADDKKNARLFVSQILIEALDALPAATPKLGPEREKQLDEIRARLED